MDFSSEEEVKKALKCNRDYMGKGLRAAATSAWFQGFVHLFIHSVLKFYRGSVVFWALGR